MLKYFRDGLLLVAVAQAQNTFVSLDSGVHASNTSIAVSMDGLPNIAYRDDIRQSLKFLKCGKPDCKDSNTIVTVDSTGWVGWYASLAVPTDGLPIITYRDDVVGNLKVVKCGTPDCTSGNVITRVDSSYLSGWFPSLAVPSDGLPVISEQEFWNADLKVVKCGDSACSSGNTIAVVDSTGSTGSHTTIAISSDGLPVIGYREEYTGDLKVAKCGNAACTSWNTISIVDSAVGWGLYMATSIAVPPDGLPIISYCDGLTTELKVVKCGTPECSLNNTITLLDTGALRSVTHTSIVVPGDGLPMIGYYSNIYGDLRAIKCGNPSCSSGNIFTAVDTAGNVGRFLSVGLSSDGFPIISYQNDYPREDLTVVKCGNAYCTDVTAIRPFIRYQKKPNIQPLWFEALQDGRGNFVDLLGRRLGKRLPYFIKNEFSTPQ